MKQQFGLLEMIEIEITGSCVEWGNPSSSFSTTVSTARQMAKWVLNNLSFRDERDYDKDMNILMKYMCSMLYVSDGPIINSRPLSYIHIAGLLEIKLDNESRDYIINMCEDLPQWLNTHYGEGAS